MEDKCHKKLKYFQNTDLGQGQQGQRQKRKRKIIVKY